MLKIARTIIPGPKFTGTIHKLLLPTRAQLSERMIVAYGDKVAVFALCDSDNTEIAARYLLMFSTGQQVGVPFPGKLDYLTTVILAKLVHRKVIGSSTGLPPEPKLEITELHVCELVPDNIADVEGAPSGKTN